MNFNEIQKQLFEIKSENDFNQIALAVFEYQYNQIDIYKSYCDLIKKTPETVVLVEDIPFLPIQFFKTFPVYNKHNKVDQVFSSSGTTGSQTSKHYVTDVKPVSYTHLTLPTTPYV